MYIFKKKFFFFVKLIFLKDVENFSYIEQRKNIEI